MLTTKPMQRQFLVDENKDYETLKFKFDGVNNVNVYIYSHSKSEKEIDSYMIDSKNCKKEIDLRGKFITSTEVYVDNYVLNELGLNMSREELFKELEQHEDEKILDYVKRVVSILKKYNIKSCEVKFNGQRLKLCKNFTIEENLMLNI